MFWAIKSPIASTQDDEKCISNYIPGNTPLPDYERCMLIVFVLILQYHQHEVHHNVCCLATCVIDQAQSVMEGNDRTG